MKTTTDAQHHKITITLLALAGSICQLLTLSAQENKIEMADIPAGSFYMGEAGVGENFDEKPIHQVVITLPFRMGRTEITNAQYEAFRPEHRIYRGKNGLSSADDEAVVFVSYQDAVDYCQWLSQKEGKNYRLPTEAEWEYACRAGSYFPYYMGDGLPDAYRKNQQTARDPQPVSLKVGQTEPNAFGLYDMHGNVEEWCLDWYGPYLPGLQTDPAGRISGDYRVTRGGSHNTPDNYLRSSNRMAMLPDDKHSFTGFRIVESDWTPTPNVAEERGNHLNQQQIIQSKYTWKVVEKPLFTAPVPYVIPPSEASGEPLFSHNHQPAITWCDNGDLLAIWFSGNEENGRGMIVAASRKRAGTDEWDPASTFFKVPDRNMTGSSLLNDGQGTLYHLNGVEAAGDWQNLMMVMRTSQDNGQTWSRPQIIAPEHTKRHQVIAGPIVTREGWLLQACDAGPGSHDGAAIHISKDKGKTWTDPWDGKPMPDFKEGGTGSTIAGIHAGVVQLKDGSLMALGRGNSIANAAGKPRMPMSISHDMGKTWTYHASLFPPIDGGQRLVLLRLREGPLLLISFTDHPLRTPKEEQGMDFTDSTGKTYKGYGLYAALSYDEGKTWPIKRLLTDGKEELLNGGAWTQYFLKDETHAEPRGYMAATQSPDNLIHLVSSRLYYCFNLAWLEQPSATSAAK